MWLTRNENKLKNVCQCLTSRLTPPQDQQENIVKYNLCFLKINSLNYCPFWVNCTQQNHLSRAEHTMQEHSIFVVVQNGHVIKDFLFKVISKREKNLHKISYIINTKRKVYIFCLLKFFVTFSDSHAMCWVTVVALPSCENFEFLSKYVLQSCLAWKYVFYKIAPRPDIGQAFSI